MNVSTMTELAVAITEGKEFTLHNETYVITEMTGGGIKYRTNYPEDNAPDGMPEALNTHRCFCASAGAFLSLMDAGIITLKE